jgi:hypothetical protein
VLLCYSYLKRRPDLPVAAHSEFATSAISEVVAEAAVAAADAAVAAADATLAAAALPTELPKQQQQVQGEQSVEELLLNLKHAECTTAAAASSSAQNSSTNRAVKQQQPKRKRSKAPPTTVADLPVATNWLGWPMSVSTKRQRAKYGV